MYSSKIFEMEDDAWPYSERVYLITSATLDEINRLVEPLEPSEIGEGYLWGQPKAAPITPDGYTVYAVWWD